MRRMRRRWSPRRAPPIAISSKAFHYRFHPLFERALAALRNGDIGKIRHIEAVFNANLPDTPGRIALHRGAGRRRAHGSGLLLHALDPHRRRRRAHRRECQRALRARPASTSTSKRSWPSPAAPRRRSSVRCSPKTARCSAACACRATRACSNSTTRSRRTRAPRCRSNRDAPSMPQIVSGGDTTFHFQLRHVIEVIEGRAQPLTGGDDAIGNMRAIDAIYRAAGLQAARPARLTADRMSCRAIRPRARSGHHQLAFAVVRRRRPGRRAGPARIHAALSAARAGSNTTPSRSGDSQRATIAAALRRRRRLTPRDIAAVGITNQRETTVLWDRATGEPVAPAIVWQDRRTAACEQLRAAGHRSRDRRAHRAAARSLFLRHQARLAARPRARRARPRGARRTGLRHDRQLAAVQPQRPAPARHRRHQRQPHAAVQSATRAHWDDRLLELFACRAPACREIVDSCLALAHAAVAIDTRRHQTTGHRHRRRPAGGAVRPGLLHARHGQEHLRHRLLRAHEHRRSAACARATGCSPPWPGGAADCQYALEGGVFMGGATVQWLRDGLGIIETLRRNRSAGGQRARHRRRVPGPGVRRPRRAALGRRGARHASSASRAARTRAHIARAALESIAFQTADLIDAMQQDCGPAADANCASMAAPRATTC